MNFNAPLLRPVRILLFPFSLLYGLGVWIRNKLFDKGILTSATFNIPIIDVGNLSAGGTGKSPMVEYIVNMLKHQHKIGVLSRGYKRKTSGYALANAQSNALEIGDEPMLLYSRHPDITVAVGEERIVALPQLLHDRPETEVIILDDAFQHRYIKAGLEILLTDCRNLFTRDWFLPTGDLRDMRASYKRADIIIITKCPPDLSEKERDRIVDEIKPLAHQHVFFSCIEYGTPYHLITKETRELDSNTEVLLISGIANPQPLKQYIARNSSTYFEILYNDHHIFTIDDLKEMRKRFENMTGERKIFITTEKDAIRLLKFGQELQHYPFYVLPISIRLLFGGQELFSGLISKFITSFTLNKQEF